MCALSFKEGWGFSFMTLSITGLTLLISSSAKCPAQNVSLKQLIEGGCGNIYYFLTYTCNLRSPSYTAWGGGGSHVSKCLNNTVSGINPMSSATLELNKRVVSPSILHKCFNHQCYSIKQQSYLLTLILSVQTLCWVENLNVGMKKQLQEVGQRDCFLCRFSQN